MLAFLIAERALMTYMSIPAGLASHVSEQRLFCLPSLVTEFDTVRTLYVSRDVRDAVCGPFALDGSDDHLIEFRQHLDAFLEGAIFTVSEDPFRKPPETMLARVAPTSAEIWDFRSVAPHPGIRCLGGFWDCDVFIALRWDYRENIANFGAEVAQCQADWVDLFGPVTPFKGGSLDDYLTSFDAV